MKQAIGSVDGIGAPLRANRIGGDTWIRYIQDRLVLDFHEGANPAVRDLSGNGNDGTFGAGAAAPTWERNRLNFASGQYVNCGSDASIDITGAISVEANIRTGDVTDPGGYIVNNLEGWPPAKGYILNIGNIIETELHFNCFGLTDNIVQATGLTLRDVWALAAGVYDLSFLRVYINGQQEQADVSTGTIASSTGALLLGYTPLQARNFIGSISFIRINATGFSAPQVLAEYLFLKWRN